jgi:hypothetical protein
MIQAELPSQDAQRLLLVRPDRAGMGGNDQCALRKSRGGECRRWVCAVERRRFPVGASPTRRTLQPEATGAVMEATKWLKPSDSGSRLGDRASVQAVT